MASYRSLSQGSTQTLEDGPLDNVGASPCLGRRRLHLGAAVLGLLLLVTLGVGVGCKADFSGAKGLSEVSEIALQRVTGPHRACTYGSESGDELAGAVPGAHCSFGASSQLPPKVEDGGSAREDKAQLQPVSNNAARPGWTLSSLGGGVSSLPSAGALTQVGTRVFYISAIRGRGRWTLKNHTPDELLTLLRRMRTLLGTGFALFDFVDGEQASPSARIGSYTLDEYLLLVQEAAGGFILPALNLDYYIDPFNLTRYPCTDGSVGPPCFWRTSDQMLALKAIASGPRIALLSSWMTFNRCEPNPHACSPTAIQSILKELRQRGWNTLLPLNIGPFNPTYGLATGMVTGLSYTPSTPWIQPAQAVVSEASQYPGIARMFAYFNGQAQHCPTQSSLDMFLANLNATQKTVGLTNMARSQASGKYTLVYPLWINAPSGNKSACNAHNGNPGYWDATTALQTDQTPFFNLIMSLVKQYN